MLSARTTDRQRVSVPSAVGWPPRSRTLRQPSQSRLRETSGGDGCDNAPAQSGRRRAFDQHRHKLAGLDITGEVDRRVPPRTPAQEATSVPALALDQHFLDPPDPLVVATLRDALHDIDEAFDAFAL